MSVLPAKHYKFMIILSPTGPYYAANQDSLSTARIYVQDKYIRAAQGGTGYAKVGGELMAAFETSLAPVSLSPIVMQAVALGVEQDKITTFLLPVQASNHPIYNQYKP